MKIQVQLQCIAYGKVLNSILFANFILISQYISVCALFSPFRSGTLFFLLLVMGAAVHSYIYYISPVLYILFWSF